MKEDTSLAALNFNYSQWERASNGEAPFYVSWVVKRLECKDWASHKGQSGGRLAGHTKWSQVCLLFQNEELNLALLRSCRWMHTSFSDLRCPHCLHGRVVEVLKKNVARTTVVESGLSHVGKSIRMLQFAVNIYPFSLTTIEFLWWALTIQRERDQC